MSQQDDHDSRLFRATSCRVLFSVERRVIGIEATNAIGQSIVIEIGGDGPASLKADIDRLFSTHPEMSDWKSPKPH